MKSMKSSFGRLSGVIFGSVFFIAGLFVAYSTGGKMAYQYFATQDWVRVPAQITHLELKSNPGKGTTYSVQARYQYTFNTQRYTATRVSLSSGSDNIGSYWQVLYRRLKQQQAKGISFAMVNPVKPAEALLDRTLRWPEIGFGLAFVFSFCVAGLVVIWFSLKPKVTDERMLATAQQYGINSNEKHGYKLALGFGTLFFIMGGIPPLFTLPEALKKGEYGALSMLIFVAVGLGIVIWALRQGKNYKTIGATPLFLDPLPSNVGGQIGGYFDVGAMSWQAPLQVTLTCLSRRKNGDETSTSINWQQSMSSYSQQTATGMRVNFLFDCPADLPASREMQKRRAIDWEVSAKGSLNINSQAHEFSRSWEILVGAEQAHSSGINIPSAHFTRQLEQSKQAARERATQQIPLSLNSGMLEISSAAGRNLGSGILGIVIGLIFCGIGGYTITQDWWPGYLFAIFGLATVVGSIFQIGREIQVEIDSQLRLLYMRRGWFGINLYKRQAALFNPDQFTVKLTSSSTSGTTRTEYFALFINNDNKKIKVAEGIRGRDTVNALRDEIVKLSFPQRF